MTVITQIVETAGGSSCASSEALPRRRAGSAPVLELVASVAVTFVAFLVLYRFRPTARVRLRDALTGALVACTGFNLAALGFSIYIGRIANFDEIFGCSALCSSSC